MEDEETKLAIGIPRVGSWILTHTWGGQIKGLKSFPKNERPNSLILFWSFRAMVGLGLLMIALGAWSLWLRVKKRLYDSRGFLRMAMWMGPAGLLAVLAGWITTEVGRQPWIVYGVLRTADGASKIGRAAGAVAGPVRGAAYLFVFGVGIAYVLRLVRKGPQAFDVKGTPQGGPGRGRTPARPLSVPEAEASANEDNRT
jgi:cytochrome d ubiquinol oxidase subunit I